MNKTFSLVALLLIVGCAAAPAHVRSMSFPWTEERCQKQQTKKDALMGSTAGLAALAGAGGLSAALPDTQDTRIGLGVSALIVGVVTAILAPFTSSAAKDYANHCTDVGE